MDGLFLDFLKLILNYLSKRRSIADRYGKGYYRFHCLKFFFFLCNSFVIGLFSCFWAECYALEKLYGLLFEEFPSTGYP